MKLKTLAIAIAMGAMPFAAQADLKIGGDFGVGYFGDANGANEMKESGSEINFDASEKVGGTVFYGHTELDINGSGNAANLEEVRVGAKGAWGDLTLGDIGNACDQLMVGGYPDKFMAPSTQGGCANPGNDVISYKRSMGAATVGVTHSPDANEHNSIAVAGSVGPVGAALAIEDGDEVGGTNIVLGLTGKIGPLAVGLRASSLDSDTAGADIEKIGINAKYTVGANSFYAGIGKGDVYTAPSTAASTVTGGTPVLDDEGNQIGTTGGTVVPGATTAASNNSVDSWAIGYNRAIGSNTTFVIEASETDGDTDTSYGIGLIHTF